MPERDAPQHYENFTYAGPDNKLTGVNSLELLDDSGQRSASNECVRLIRKLRCIGMDDEAERVLAQLRGGLFGLRKP